jgi:hypothetical protein
LCSLWQLSVVLLAQGNIVPLAEWERFTACIRTNLPVTLN